MLSCLDFETSGQRLQIVLGCLTIEGKEQLRSTGKPSLCMYIPAHVYRRFMLLLIFPYGYYEVIILLYSILFFCSNPHNVTLSLQPTLFSMDNYGRNIRNLSNTLGREEVTTKRFTVDVVSLYLPLYKLLLSTLHIVNNSEKTKQW